MRDDRELLRDILEAIENIEKYAVRGRGACEGDELIQTWMLHHLQIIGEASRALSPAFREQHSQIPWSKIVGMRHILVHHYFEINFDLVWSVIEVHLPEFKNLITAILQDLGGP
ncbi:MAG: DUF86 domain-containing protein [Thermodesulfobacteriota bacterium]